MLIRRVLLYRVGRWGGDKKRALLLLRLSLLIRVLYFSIRSNDIPLYI